MTATFLAKRDSVVESDLGYVWPPAVDDEVAEAFAEVGLVVQAPTIGQHLKQDSRIVLSRFFKTVNRVS